VLTVSHDLIDDPMNRINDTQRDVEIITIKFGPWAIELETVADKSQTR
jgi:hypothetical protein